MAAALRLLVVEDSEANRMVVAAMLEGLPVEIDLAADGAAALDAAAARRYDLILMDLTMPGLDGLSACRAIRRQSVANAVTPIVALTARVTSDIEARCRAAGMDGYLAKPVSRRLLLQCLAEWCGGLETAAPPDLIDRPVLAQLRSDVGVGAYASLVAGFVEEVRDRQGRLAAAAAGGDVRAVEHEAHALKSTSATYGARQLSLAAARIEAAAEAGDLTSVGTDIDGLAGLVERSLAALQGT